MGYTLPLGIDVYTKVTVFAAGTIPIIGAIPGSVLAVDFDTRRVGLWFQNTAPTGADFIAFREHEPVTLADSQLLGPGAGSSGILIFEWPPRNQIFIAAATANSNLRICEFIAQPIRQGVAGGAQRIRSGMQNV